MTDLGGIEVTYLAQLQIEALIDNREEKQKYLDYCQFGAKNKKTKIIHIQ